MYSFPPRYTCLYIAIELRMNKERALAQQATYGMLNYLHTQLIHNNDNIAPKTVQVTLTNDINNTYNMHGMILKDYEENNN